MYKSNLTVIDKHIQFLRVYVYMTMTMLYVFAGTGYIRDPHNTKPSNSWQLNLFLRYIV